jgi:hypothetical protein
VRPQQELDPADLSLAAQSVAPARVAEHIS